MKYSHNGETESTGLKLSCFPGFRHVTRYSPNRAIDSTAKLVPESMPLSRSNHLNRASEPRWRNIAGLSLVEVMVAFGIFSIMSLGALSALIQTRKMSEDNLAQATAAVIAQGIIEQVHLNAYSSVSDTATGLNLELKFTGSDTNNLASIQQYNLPWAANATDFTEIGARVDPSDPTSAILGVLLDLDYKVGSNVIRPGRYMKMRVNVRRVVHSGDDNVEIIVTYQWQPPSRNNTTASNFYLTRELRTIRSQTPSY